MDCLECRTSIVETGGTQMENCSHFLCTECIVAAAKRTKTLGIKCASIKDGHNCDGQICHDDLEFLVPEEDYNEYLERIALSSAVALVLSENYENENKAEAEELSGSLNDLNLSKEEIESGWDHKALFIDSLIRHHNMTTEDALQYLDKLPIIETQVVIICKLCTEEIPAGEGIVLKDCDHMFCKCCLRDHIKNSNTAEVLCPFSDEEYNCDEPLKPSEMRELVDSEEYDRHFSELSLLEAKSQMANAFSCYTQQCPGFYIVEADTGFFTCEICNQRNCMECKATHTGSCAQYQEMLKKEKVPVDVLESTNVVIPNFFSHLRKRELRKHEILNELCHSEWLHIRQLKIMDRLFYQPLKSQQILSPDLLTALFPNLEEIIDLHDQFNWSLRKLKNENLIFDEIGPVLLEMFDGENGQKLEQAVATYCARQQLGLEHLSKQRKRDAKLHAFLAEAESNPACRRLEIKDMIPTEMQRLTKYPLLFENLLNCTEVESVEYKNFQRVLERSKEILTSVNNAKQRTEDEERLAEIQKRLDKSSLEKTGNEPEQTELKDFDFTRHRLVHSGNVKWKLQKANGEKLKDILLVLLEDMVVLLRTADNRYVLKFHKVLNAEKSGEIEISPVIPLNTLHITQDASDKHVFYLLSKSSSTPFMFHLVCSTADERNLWFHQLTGATQTQKHNLLQRN